MVRETQTIKAINNIDVEGAEQSVFANASKLVSSLQKGYIFMEVDFQKRFYGSQQPKAVDPILRQGIYLYIEI